MSSWQAFMNTPDKRNIENYWKSLKMNWKIGTSSQNNWPT